MKNNKWILSLGLLASTVLTAQGQLLASDTSQISHTRDLTNHISSMPYIGLVSDEINFGPITVSHVHIDGGDKLCFAKPGEKLNGNLRYKIDSSDQSKFNLCHLVVGIKGVGAQDCIAHTINLWDSKGKGNFTLEAPQEKGVYEVRFQFSEGLTCDEARDAWNSKKEEPSSGATIGIIVVE